MAKNDNTIWWVIGIITVLVLVVGGFGFFSNKCSGEFENIIVGTMDGNGECCSGLVAKAPSGFTGGAWCVRPELDIVCLSGLEEIEGVTVEGIYAKSSPDIRPTTIKLLKQVECYEEISDEQKCLSSGGLWVDVSEIDSWLVDLEIRKKEQCHIYEGTCLSDGGAIAFSSTVIGSCDGTPLRLSRDRCYHFDFREDTCLMPKSN